MLVKAEVFALLGGFETGMSWGMTDIDFSRRALRAGVKCRYVPSAMIDHLLPAHRLRIEYLQWTSLRFGMGAALTNRKLGGFSRMALRCFLRVAHGLAIGLPLLVAARIRSDDAGILEQRCSLWFAEGCARMALHLAFPSLFPQRAMLERLQFRREPSRSAGSDGGAKFQFPPTSC
jgi:hypothetical protein